MSRFYWVLLFVAIFQLARGQGVSPGQDSYSQEQADRLLVLADSLKDISVFKVNDLANEAIIISDAINYDRGLAHAYTLSAWVNRHWGLNTKAADLAIEAIDISRAGEFTPEEIEATLQLGLILRDQESFSDSDSIFSIGLNLAKQVKDTLNMAYFLNGKGECARLTEQYDLAWGIYDQVLEWHSQLNNQFGIGAIWNNQGLILLARGENEAAIEILTRSVELGKEIGYKALIMESADALSRAYLNIGETETAEVIALENLELSKENNFKKYEAIFYDNLTLLYEHKEDFEKAHDYFKKYTQLRNQLNQKEINRTVAGLKDEQENLRKEAELTALRATRSKQQRITWGLIGGLSIISILALIFFRSRMRARSMNKQLVLQFEELERVQREKDSLLHIVAHDLKAPLIKIEGLSEMVGGAGALNPAQTKSLDFIKQISTDGKQLIQDLLDIHIAEDQETQVYKEDFGLVDLVDSLSQSYARRAGQKNIDLRFEATGQEVRCHTDRIAVVRVVDNLLSNAIKYSPSGKKVWLKVWQAGTQAMIEVSDEGPGFSKEDQERMYQKFQMLTARPTGGESSNGLGLAIVKSLLGRLQGKIDLISEPGNGASFTISFPRTI